MVRIWLPPQPPRLPPDRRGARQASERVGRNDRVHVSAESPRRPPPMLRLCRYLRWIRSHRARELVADPEAYRIVSALLDDSKESSVRRRAMRPGSAPC